MKDPRPPSPPQPAVWFPAVRAGSGTDVFTERLAEGLNARGIRAQITWLPLRAEYAPWTVPKPKPPAWANIVHANSWLHPRFLPRDLPLITTLHFCVHDPALAPYKRLAQRLYHAVWIKQVEASHLARAACIVAVSRYTAQAAQRAFGIEGIQVIYNGVDTTRFHPATRQEPNRPFRLLYVGNWSTRKGVDLLAPIMEQLGNDFELLYTADRNRAHERFALPPNSRCLGRLSGEALITAYQQADALLFPSRLEGLPLTVLEAQSCGLPVIAARSSSLPEVVKDDATGLSCPQDDIHAFVSAARKLANNTDFWRRMHVAARERAETVFSLGMMLDRYMEIYRSVLADAPTAL
ncbi:Glycosyltransferase involved in cell wall bisynthesis [Desulfacinum hydrothermale DSM 13146]|uniref:Glycosyltransferase involved in cell wall bisynthesis n=1 Tax=Desulfacinum hydrothermale DSM 13146 TaxID=1121390 RepID=A0A1W1XEW3_9BACT|nr:glycosyltransferase family 4 protein [Desulfacinum hydrothermale]SMC22446.1 Glycosyltransferase involved in cell wall bisynthesis [Desulfacinum hydrothermale DSM 13146]